MGILCWKPGRRTRLRPRANRGWVASGLVLVWYLDFCRVVMRLYPICGTQIFPVWYGPVVFATVRLGSVLRSVPKVGPISTYGIEH